MDDDAARQRVLAEQERVSNLVRELRGELGSEGDASSELADYDQHPADSATETFEHEKDLGILEELENELGELQAALDGALQVLAPGGRLAAISFHSLEDGLVKRFMQKHSQDDPVFAGLPQIPAHARAKLRRIGRAIHPTEAEVAANPRARSAVLRVAERVAA